MSFFDSVSGTVEISITSPDIAQTMQRILQSGITILSSRAEDLLTVRLTIPRKCLKKARGLCSRRGDTLTLCKRQGAYWTVKGAFRRPILLLGCLLLLLLELYVPGRIFFVCVEGNTSLPERRILETAAQCGIGFGANRREVRSEKMKNHLLEAMPELQWAGINTYGCVAVISVAERSDPEPEVPQPQVSSIVAVRDGIIRSCTATSGNLLCVPGQAVVKGQVLISGYTDCGLRIQASRSQGEIFAQTSRGLKAVTPLDRLKTGDSSPCGKKISLLLGKKRINLWKDSGICDTTCGRMYQEYYVTLPGGFRLPVAIAVDSYTSRTTEMIQVPEEEGQQLLSEFAGRYLFCQMIAGEITRAEQVFSRKDSLLYLNGQYICTEMIGMVKAEQIGEYNGKNS